MGMVRLQWGGTVGQPLSPGEERFLGLADRGERIGDVPAPPYQAVDVRLKFIGVRFRPGAARRLLPPDLEPAGNDGGLFCVYSVASGWGIAPYTACYAAVEVKGFDAPDGSSGYYIAAGYYSGRGGQFMRKHYNTNALDGSSHQFQVGERLIGEGGAADTAALRLVLGAPASGPQVWTGVHHYLGLGPNGKATVFPIAFSCRVFSAEPIAVEITDDASERMQWARPTELVWGMELIEASLTFGVPQPAAGPNYLTDTGGQAALLDTFARLGRGAVIVTPTAEVISISAGARPFLGRGLALVDGRLRASNPADQAEFVDRIASATGQTLERVLSLPMGVRRPDGKTTIVDVVPMGRAATGGPAALVLLSDPEAREPANRSATLQLLGLTPAEARIAELVGAGLSPREAGETLGKSEGTVRTTLKHIYQKLQIGRQSELARIVARL